MDENTELKINDISDELLIINKRTLDTLFSIKNCEDVIALYLFYYKTAKWQKTNIIKANDSYIQKCLNWGKNKITNTKKVLKDNGLIDIVQRRIEGRIDGWYIEVKYLISTSNNQFLQKQEVAKTSSCFQDTNALNNNKMLKNNINNMIIIYNWEDNKICDCMTKNKTKCMRKSTYNIDGKNYCNQHSKHILSKLLTKNEDEESPSKFKKPTIEEIEKYCSERKNNIDAEYFFDYYESNGWKVGKNSMKDWKACIRTWERNDRKNTKVEDEEIKEEKSIVQEEDIETKKIRYRCGYVAGVFSKEELEEEGIELPTEEEYEDIRRRI